MTGADEPGVTREDTSQHVHTPGHHPHQPGPRPGSLRGPGHDGVQHGGYPHSGRVRGCVYIPQHGAQSSILGEIIKRNYANIRQNETYLLKNCSSYF